MSIHDSGEGGSTPNPQKFAVTHQRPKNSFVGCSRITDYEVLGKLGEGTFGLVFPIQCTVVNADYLSSEVHRARSKKTGALVALKKIIMHNEKDGVGAPSH